MYVYATGKYKTTEKKYDMIKSMTGFGRAEMIDGTEKNCGRDEIRKSSISGYQYENSKETQQF